MKYKDKHTINMYKNTGNPLVGGTLLSLVPADRYIQDSVPPILVNSSLDLGAGTITLIFDEVYIHIYITLIFDIYTNTRR
jgi:hypothetical protein